MSLLEGFGDHVMDAVGKDLVPGVERISARFHGRREQRTPFERAMLRITGMDLKMEQYRKGEAFVAGIERLGGAAALRRLWDGPETLPTPDEIDDPAGWVRRMGLNRVGGGADEPTTRRGCRMSDATSGAPGPGAGPGGVPAAIALTPILAARYRARDVEAIRAAAPGARHRHDRVRRPPRRGARRRRGHAPRPPARRDLRPHPRPGPGAALGALGDGRRRARPDAGQPRPRADDHQRPRRVLAPDRRVRDADDPGGRRGACRSCSSCRPSARGSRSSPGSCAT